jgi:lipoprotein-anchoring transpeptidase ErfK/SrfK
LKKEVTVRLSGLGLAPAEHCIVVSIDQQKLWFFEGGEVETFVVSTARAGRGCVQDSLRTPDGLHRVGEATGRLASEWPTPEDNLITSRIFWLEGLEPGHNQGRDAADRVVDSRSRFVYIHGTNQHAMLGRPNSHGCVLMSDDDIIRLHPRVPVGTIVLIRD